MRKGVRPAANVPILWVHHLATQRYCPECEKFLNQLRTLSVAILESTNSPHGSLTIVGLKARSHDRASGFLD
jgi:hypothetical protein